MNPAADVLAGIAANELTLLHGPGDPEGAHGRADKILCELLRELGYGDTVVAAFERVEKWYA